MTIKELFHLRRMKWEPVATMGVGLINTEYRLGRSHAGEKILEEKNGTQTWFHWIKDGKIDESMKFVNGEEADKSTVYDVDSNKSIVLTPLTREMLAYVKYKNDTVLKQKKATLAQVANFLGKIGVETIIDFKENIIKEKLHYYADKQGDIYNVHRLFVVGESAGLVIEYETISASYEIKSVADKAGEMVKTLTELI
jgi:hypothetical protein